MLTSLTTSFYVIGTQLQRDIKFILQTEKQQDQREKIFLAAIRIITACGMVVGAGVALKSLTLFPVSPFKAALKAAIGISFFVFNHDVFTMAKNATHQSDPGQRVTAGFRTIWLNLRDIALTGAKSLNDPLHHRLTEGTIARDAWDNLLAKLQAIIASQK